jgi:hypothetical protein
LAGLKNVRDELAAPERGCSKKEKLSQFSTQFSGKGDSRDDKAAFLARKFRRTGLFNHLFKLNKARLSFHENFKVVFVRRTVGDDVQLGFGEKSRFRQFLGDAGVR